MFYAFKVMMTSSITLAMALTAADANARSSAYEEKERHPHHAMKSVLDTTSVTAYANGLIDSMLNVFNNPKLSHEKKREDYQKIMLENMAVSEVTDFVLGIYKRDMDRNQRTRFENVFSRYLAQSYSSIIDSISGNVTASLRGVQRYTSDRYVANVEIVAPATDMGTIRMGYVVMMNDRGELKIGDIVFEGVNYLNMYRAQVKSALTYRSVRITNEKIDEMIDQFQASLGG